MPTYNKMLLDAVVHIKSYTKGASRPAIKKYVEETFKIECSAPALRAAIKKAVNEGANQAKNKGATPKKAAAKKKSSEDAERAMTMAFVD